MRKLPHTAAEDLLELVMRRYERASTILTSNRPVDDWGKLLGDNAAVTALLDRLLHHAHVLKCGPRSWRTKVQTDLRHGSCGIEITSLDALGGRFYHRPSMWPVLRCPPRCLDTLYLRPGADIALWRRRDEVVIEWDNRSHRIAGAPAWSAIQGRVSVSMERFKASVTDFHERFLAAMRDRVADVTFHWSRAEVRLDPAGLIDAQRHAETVLTNALALRAHRAIPWEVMTACLRNEGAG